MKKQVKSHWNESPFVGGLPIMVDTVNYLNVCAHCGDCLKQIVADPNKLNVVLFYRNEKGEIVEWKPTEDIVG